MERIRHVKIALLLAIAGAFATVVMIPYLTETLLVGKHSIPKLALPAVVVGQVIQSAVIIFFAAWGGLVLASRSGLNVPFLRKWVYGIGKPVASLRWFLVGAAGSIAGSFVILALDVYWFRPYMPKIESVQDFVWWKGALTLFYGGIFEETLVRLLIMSLLVVLCAKLLRVKGQPIPSYIYWIAIVFAALLFGAGHLPAAQIYFGELTSVVVLRTIILNAVLGIWFGYLYWRKGLEYAMVAHMAADLLLHGIIEPLGH